MTSAAAIDVKNLDKLYIGGRWVQPSSDRRIEVISPMTEEVVFTVADALEPDIDRAVDAAREAFDNGPWPHLSHAERAAFLTKFAQGLRARGDDLAHVWTDQMGALYSLTQHAGEGAAAIFDTYAAMADSFAFEVPRTPSDGIGRALIVHEPVGVVAAIVPWNGPLWLACSKIAPALLAGCTVVLKPAPETPVDAYILAEIAESIGLPPGVLNVVAANRVSSERLVRNPGVDKVSFTGSSVAGRHIASILGGRMARYTMELGGKSAAIVLDDFDVDEAVQNLTGSLCMLSGQVCAALTRIIVPRRRHDDFVDSFTTAMKRLRPGNPYDVQSSMGPLAMKRQLERVQGYIEKGKAEGAKLAVGGDRPADLNRGFYFEPTLFADVKNDMTIAREEIFGPVLSLISADSPEHALQIANDSDYGLNGAVFTNDNQRAYDIARRVRTGNFSQNRFRTDASIAFGGFKQSGVGREGSEFGLMPYLEVKTLLLD